MPRKGTTGSIFPRQGSANSCFSDGLPGGIDATQPASLHLVLPHNRYAATHFQVHLSLEARQEKESHSPKD